jgi:uridine kinase
MIKILITTFFITCSLFSDEVLIVGIAGGSGSGKTTLASKIHNEFPNSILITQDSYYKDLSNLTLAEREQVNFDHPNSIEFSLLFDHLKSLKNGDGVSIPLYDFCTHSRTKQTIEVEPAPIIIVEGILLFAIEEIRNLFDIKLFVDTDSDIRLLRRIRRDINERGRELSAITTQYLSTVKPMHDAFVEPSKRFADLIIPEGGENKIALDFIVTNLKSYH